LQEKQINSIVVASNLQQLPICCKQISICCVVSWLQMSTTVVNCRKQNKASLHQRRRNTLLPHKKSQAGHNTSTTDYSCFL